MDGVRKTTNWPKIVNIVRHSVNTCISTTIDGYFGDRCMRLMLDALVDGFQMHVSCRCLTADEGSHDANTQVLTSRKKKKCCAPWAKSALANRSSVQWSECHMLAEPACQATSCMT